MRGKIRNREFASQLMDFSGVRYGKITPTDIDVFLEFGDHAFVIGEIKYGDTEVPYGQRLALERLARALLCENVLLFFAKHDNNDSDINLSTCIVTEYYCKRTKRTPEKTMTVVQLIDKFVKNYVTLETPCVKKKK